MADTKISAFSSGAPVQGSDELVIARGGSNYKLTFTNILAGISPLGVITKTVAQMQALIGSFVPGQQYKITGMAAAQAVVLDATFTAISASELSTTGYSDNFTSLATLTPVSVRVDYILATDELTLIYCPSSRNLITATSLVFTGLYSVPLDSPTIFDNQFYNPGYGGIDPAATLYGSTFSAGAFINMAAGTIFQGFTETGASIELAGTASFTGTLDGNSTLKMLGTQNLTNCRIGNGKTLDMTTWASNYSATGKIYIDGLSTFVCDVAQDMDGKTDLPINAWSDGGDYSACGVFTNIQNLGANTVISNIFSSINDHPYLLIHTALNGHVGYGGANIITNGSTVKTMATDDDRFETYSSGIERWYEAGNTLIQ